MNNSYENVVNYEKYFNKYFESVNIFIGDIELVFEFKDNLKGISYQYYDNNIRKEYLSSRYLIRDREALEDNETWQKLKKYFNKNIIVGYEGYWFYCPESVWSPSVDAVFLLDAIYNQPELNLNNILSVVDYGCGTGIVGISLAKKYSHIKSLSLIDTNPLAIYSSFINAYGNNLTIEYTLSNSLNKSLNYDLGIATPYYFPIEKLNYDSPLERIIEAGTNSAEMVNKLANICKNVFFIYSSTTEQWFLRDLKYDFRKVSNLHIPFSLGDNVSSMNLVKAAEANDLLEIVENNQFKYWHTIYACKLIG